MWFKVDDKLHAHAKSRKAGKAAIGVWTLAGSWSSDNETDGFIPEGVIAQWGTRADAARLVAAGLWHVARKAGEDGWRFHDWAHFQPSAAVTAARRAKEREAGLRGNHTRWHVDRGVNDPDCEYCYRVPDGEPDDYPIGGGESAPTRPVPVPEPDSAVSNETARNVGSSLEQIRDDVARLCAHLADRIAEDGSKRPVTGKGWQDAARLMLDKDGRSEDEIHAAIDWCQAHPFWRSNILSMPKLREKFDQLRKVAAAEQQGPRAGGRTQEWKAMQERQMARAIEREREMGIRP